jgi:hypothetical protein
VAIARHDLGRDRLRLQAETSQDLLFDAGIEVRRRPDRAGDLPEPDLFVGAGEAMRLALRFRKPPENLESERRAGAIRPAPNPPRSG